MIVIIYHVVFHLLHQFPAFLVEVKIYFEKKLFYSSFYFSGEILLYEHDIGSSMQASRKWYKNTVGGVTSAKTKGLLYFLFIF